ncbi:hypothetical protein ScPMuIL_006380 [Solemya velum]
MEDTIKLKQSIDLNELRDPSGKGIEFEIDEEDGQIRDRESNVENSYFGENEVFHNWYTQEKDSDTDTEMDCMPFERLGKKMEDISGDGGVLKKILQPGSGRIVPEDALVRTHFNGFLEFADEPYDSSRLRRDVQKFRLGQGEVIPGWDIGVATMKQGELARFLIKPEYAYGEMGCPPRIPGSASILFEIELLSFVDKAGADDYSYMTAEEKKNIGFEQLKKVFLSEKEEGNQLFAAKQIRQALQKYKKAMDILEAYSMKDENEEKEQKALLLKLYMNMSLCCVNLGHSGRAITYAKRALDIQRNSAKALYLCAKAFHQLSEFEKAREHYKRAHKLSPQSQDINTAMVKLENDMKKFKMVEKEVYRRMLSQPKGETEQDNVFISVTCSNFYREFKDDAERVELPFPSIGMSVGEINCILETAVEIGLDAQQSGTGSSVTMKIIKKTPGKLETVSED